MTSPIQARKGSRPAIISDDEEDDADVEFGNAAAALAAAAAKPPDTSHLKTGKVLEKRKRSLTDFHHTTAKLQGKKGPTHGVFSMGAKTPKIVDEAAGGFGSDASDFSSDFSLSSDSDSD
jgi:hypothetical protein